MKRPGVVRFTDQYQMAAGLYDASPDELRRRDQGQTRPPRRWLAIRDDEAISAVSTWLRPDDRMFLNFVGPDVGSYAVLAETAATELGRPVHTFVDADDLGVVEAMQSSGFETEITEERFRIRFDRALTWLVRAWVPTGFSTHRANEVDEDRLFTLDNTIRQDVPGTDGWRGDRQWFHEELIEAPPFDGSAYLVAVDDRNGEYVGLVRVWRNANGPRLGLIGVVRQYRNSPVAPALLKQALTAAAEWGHDTFTTETSPSNRVTYPRMKRIGAESLGQLLQMVRRTRGSSARDRDRARRSQPFE